MATAFTSTTSAPIANNYKTGNIVRVYNQGDGALLILDSQNETIPATAAAGNYDVKLNPGDLFETQAGEKVNLFGIFLATGTAMVSEHQSR